MIYRARTVGRSAAGGAYGHVYVDSLPCGRGIPFPHLDEKPFDVEPDSPSWVTPAGEQIRCD